MVSMVPRKKNWTLTKDALDKLLALFDRDPERAGRKYELMRAKLVRFFQSRRLSLPEELADEVMNRIARRLEEGEVIRLETLADYFYGVAHNVLKEFMRSVEKTIPSLDALPHLARHSEHPDHLQERLAERIRSEQRLECLESCVSKLEPETRKLILSYYEEEHGRKVRNRRQLAEAMSIPMNALRIRAHRIRARLEKCVRKCLNRSTGHEMD